MLRGAPLLALIGNTPIIPLRMEPENRTIWAKCEFLNPSGSIKDRLARTIITDAYSRGLLNKDSDILECTSGNTGIAFAMIGAACGYPVTIVMSERASGERRRIIEHFGAKLILFNESGYRHGIELTQQMAAKDSRYFLPRQFENPLNAWDHEHETGQEILKQAPGPIAAFVSGYGTGGTLAGCSRALKTANASTKIFAMEPAESALLAGEEACCHWIEGIAGGFIPKLLQGVAIDGTCKVSSPDAIAMTRRLNRQFGLLVGSSSGANVAAALSIASSMPEDAVVVTLLCDRAERYFSTRLFET
ncbi:MAG: PLP-dependent cysteine synthase family protein [Pirellula sp.]|jgi:cysteine synthase A